MSQTSPTATRDNLAVDRTTLANKRTLIVLAPIIMVIGLCSYFRFKKLIEKRMN